MFWSMFVFLLFLYFFLWIYVPFFVTAIIANYRRKKKRKKQKKNKKYKGSVELRTIHGWRQSVCTSRFQLNLNFKTAQTKHKPTCAYYKNKNRQILFQRHNFNSKWRIFAGIIHPSTNN